MRKFFIRAIVGAAALATGFSSALANTITISGGPAFVTCNGAAIGACEGIIGGAIVLSGQNVDVGAGTMGTFSTTAADQYDGGNSSEANETLGLNEIAGTSFLEADANKSSSNPPLFFTTLAEFFMLKIANTNVFFRNTSGGSLDIVYNPNGATASGLSHYTEWGGDTPEVPLPAAIWLMIAGMCGLGFAGRKKKTA